MPVENRVIMFVLSFVAVYAIGFFIAKYQEKPAKMFRTVMEFLLFSHISEPLEEICPRHPKQLGEHEFKDRLFDSDVCIWCGGKKVISHC